MTKQIDIQDRLRFRAWVEDEKLLMEDIQEVSLGMPCFNLILNDERCKVEQCTGLKDKNGKLIYEGDIVKIIYNEELNTLSKQIYPMLFNDKVAKFGFKHPDGHFFYFTNDEDFSYEVIGNIHENPDLLENKDE